MKKALLLSVLLVISLSVNAFATVITFSEYPEGTIISTQYSSLGVTFLAGTDGTLPIIGIDPASPDPPILGPTETLYFWNGDFTMDFSGGFDDISFTSGFWDNSGAAEIGVYGSDDSTLLTTLTNNTTGIVTFDLSSYSVGKVYFNSWPDLYGAGIDTLSFNVVPIPAAVYLLGAGFIGLLGLRKKLKK
jgi:hypothetical protein